MTSSDTSTPDASTASATGASRAGATRPAARRRARTAGVAILAAAALGAAPLLGGAAATAAPAADTAATPDTAALAGPLATQEIAWEDCGFEPGVDIAEGMDVSNVECATIQVPRDWKHPDPERTWDIRISQATNIDPANPRYEGTVLANPGGPGGSGLGWSAILQQTLPDLRPSSNFVGFDPRGVGRSSLPECRYTYTPDEADPISEFEVVGATCSADPDVRTISTEQTAYDMDFIRHLLGLERVSYVGYSYGTWLGAWFGNLFAENIDRMVLDSSIDATQATLQSTWDLQPLARDRQFRMHLLNWIARHDATYGLGTDPREISQRYFAATEADPDAAALVWFTTGGASAFPNNAAYPIAAETVRSLIEQGEADAAERRAAPAEQDPAAAASAVLDRVDAGVAGEAQLAEARATLEALSTVPTREQSAQQQQRRTAAEPEERVYADVFDYVRCNDGQWTQGRAYWADAYADLAERAPLTAQWGLFASPPMCAFWKTTTQMPVAGDDFPETVVVQSELDSQTGWEGGRVAGLELPNTSFVAVDNEGSHGVFPYGTEEVDRPLIDFLRGGERPADLTVAQGKPLPEEETVFESWAELDGDAEHVDPDFTDPTVPAESGTLREVSPAGVEALASAETERMLRSSVQAIYGPAGVEVLDAR
jgi:pimeloyl-ACP methyl ester carboxylesterase